MTASTEHDTADGTEQDTSRNWLTDLFPYEEPYQEQRHAIPRIVETGKENGFVAMEGECGTGKTLAALSAGVSLVRDPDTKFKRVMAVTSVKQQIEAFEQDIQAINQNLSEDTDPVDAMTLVSKGDVCTYTETGFIDNDSIYGECERLRDTVRNQISSSAEPSKQLKSILNRFESDTLSGTSNLKTDDYTTPYNRTNPTEQNVCAFYAKARLRQLEDKPLLDINGMMTRDRIVAQASENGVCPHSAMLDMLDTPEVLIGNYSHIFDPTTITAMTGELLNEETFVVVDEAHMLVPKVREMQSDSISYTGIDRAISQTENEVLDPTSENAEAEIQRVMSDNGVTPDDIKEFLGTLREIRDGIAKFAVKAMDEYDPNWENTYADISEPVEYGLRDPERSDADDFSEWLDITGLAAEIEDLAFTGKVIEAALDAASKESETVQVNTVYAESVTRVLMDWVSNDNTRFFRQVTMTPRDYEKEDTDYLWERAFKAEMEMKNCIPREPIRDTLDNFGGGILMSATLAPLDIYKDEIGLDSLEADKNRKVVELTYGMNFPPERRDSMIVNTTKFTSTNRGNPYDDNNATREQYLSVIEDTITETDGNVLVCMPSYAEAEWVDYELGGWGSPVDKEVKSDTSSTEDETSNQVSNRLKDWFFSGDGKVLITSLRGTLTEGVDYDGDKLDACVVCGLPIRGLGGEYPDAIKHAYESRFGDSEGFSVAFNVPAVRKARQALGRVIRGTNDEGVRVLADERYLDSGFYGVRDLLPDHAKTEYTGVEPEMVGERIGQFWSTLD